MARLFKRGSIYYAWIPQLQGGTVKRSTNCTDRRAAEIRAGELERAAVDPGGEAQARKTLRDALALMIAQAQSDASAGEGSEATVRFYSQKAGSLLDAVAGALQREPIAPIYLREMNAGLVDDYIKLRRTEVQDSTIRKELTTWRLALRQAKRRRWWLGDLDELFPRFGQNSKPRDAFVRPEWVLPLMNAMVRPLKYRGGTLGPEQGHELFAIVCFSIATSAEWSAIWRARPEDIEPDLSSVHIRGSKNTLRDRIVPIQLPHFSFLLDYARRHGNGSMLLFRDHSSHFRTRLREACVRAGIPHLSPNDLRRTHAKWLRLAGVAPANIAPSMGHKDSRMVENVYGRASAEELAPIQASQIRSTGLLMGGASVHKSPNVSAPDTTSDRENSGLEPKNTLHVECPGPESNWGHADFQSETEFKDTTEESPHFAEWWAANGRSLVSLAADIVGADASDAEKIEPPAIEEAPESGRQNPLSSESEVRS